MVISLQEQDLIVDLIMMKRMHWIHVLMKWNIFGRRQVSCDGRLGLGCDLRLNDRLSINIEAKRQCFIRQIHSKKAGNCDWQLNALVGLSIKLGKSYTKTAPIYYEPEPVVVEQPKPAPVVEQPQPKKEVVVSL